MNQTAIVVRKPVEKRPLEDLSVDEMTILKWILSNRVEEYNLDSSSSDSLVAGSCENNTKPSYSIKGGKILDYVSVLSVSQKE